MYPFAQFHFSKLTYNLLHFQRRVSALFCVSIFYGCFAIVVWLSGHMPPYIIGGYMARQGRRGGLPAGACRGNVPQTCKQNFLPSVVASPGTRTKGVFACPAPQKPPTPLWLCVSVFFAFYLFAHFSWLPLFCSAFSVCFLFWPLFAMATRVK